jgi:hypothetical protein
MYQERDLAIVAVAALGAGYLLGQSLQADPVTPVQASDAGGMTIVQRIIVREPMPDWPRELRAMDLQPVAPFVPALHSTEATEPKPEPIPVVDVTPPPAKPRAEARSICSPGRKVEFRLHGVLRWRCQY